MTREELYRSLDDVNHSREKRAEMSDFVLGRPETVRHLVDIAFEVDDPISNRACWVMEFAAKEDLSYILPFLDELTENLGRVHLDSSVRPLAKICEYLVEAYFAKTPNPTQKTLTDIHLKRITEACFDWLIGDHKVAAKAYSMTCLLLLGKKFEWIHPELKMILERNYASGSAAYKARARRTLSKLKF